MKSIQRTLWLIGWLLLLSLPATAQESTAEPLPEEVFTTAAQVVFPQGIAFSIGLQLPAENLAALTLTISQPDQSEVILQLNPQTAQIRDPFTELRFLWPVPQNTPPRLFEQIDYRWRIVTTRDRIIEIEGSVIYDDNRADWIRDLDELGRIHVTYPAGSFDPATLRDELDAYYSLLERNLGVREPFTFLLFPPDLPPGCSQSVETGLDVVIYLDGSEFVEIECDAALAERVYQRSGYEVAQIDPEVDFAAQIADRVFDVFYAPVWGENPVPAWFKAGLRLFYEPGTKPAQLAASRQNLRLRQAFSSSEMKRLPTERDSAAWLAQSYGMVLYSAYLMGVPELFDFAESLGSAESFEAAYEAASGQSVELMISNWQNWIYREEAALVYGYTPYNPITPTPTLTFTNTPPPPTNTPTITPTATVTGELSPTPSLTPTATRTPRPPTATRTPRPAVSFVIGATPTLTAAPVQPQSPPPTQTLIVAAAGGLLVGLGLLVLILISRRRR